jgi:Fe-S cluster assembly iron-binding protein IscA
MLNISPQAANLLVQARESSDIPDDAVVRVAESTEPAGSGISLGFVDEPLAGDAVGNAHGLDICVAPEVAPKLDDATLDVVQEEGETRLVVVPTPEP